MTADDLLVIAEDLARREAGRPRQASLKRAVSTAYHALVHAIAHECVVQTVGWRFRSPDYWRAVTPVCRAVDHGGARSTFQRIAKDPAASSAMRTLAGSFVDLQAARIRADYDPQPTSSRSDATLSADLARQAATLLRTPPDDSKRLLAVQLICQQR